MAEITPHDPRTRDHGSGVGGYLKVYDHRVKIYLYYFYEITAMLVL